MSAITTTELQAVDQAAHPAIGPQALECLSFRLGAEEYGIDILCVQEIRGWDAPTRIAGAPADVLGVLNLRGVIVPVIDLRLRFGLPAAFDAVTVTVVLNLDGKTVGLVVDAVSTVVALSAGQIKATPAFSTGIQTAPLRGIATVQEDGRQRLLMVIDIERLLAHADLGAAA